MKLKRRKIPRVNKMRNCFFRRTGKTDKSLAKLTEKMSREDKN